MTTKTPVSILQETMCRLGTEPKYELICDGTGTHNPTFKFRVCASNETAIGTGTSKKGAKQEAARLLLDKLVQQRTIDVLPPAVSLEPSFNIDTSPKNEILGNPRVTLKKMCEDHSLPTPDYKEIDEKGEPHEKTFTLACWIGKRNTVGIACTKKQAKNIAASNMIKLLKESLSEILKEIEEDKQNRKRNIEEIAAKYKAAVGPPVKKMKTEGNFSNYHKFFIDTSEELMERGREVLKKVKWPLSILEDKSLQNVDADWMKILNDIADAMELSHCKVVPCHCYGSKECVFIQMTHKSDAVFYGVANNFEGAVQNAALFGLRFIQTQLK